MGNEQGSPYLLQKQQQMSTNSGTASPYDFESLIVIRGERRTGKTTLVSRMKGQHFNPTYTPTAGLEVFQFPWKLNSSHCNNVMISVWDVVEHSLQPNKLTNIPIDPSNPSSSQSEAISQNKPLPDAQTIDTLKRANGLVILIDSRNESSIQLAENLICEAPEECQIVVFSNFVGEKNVSPAIPKKLLSHVGRFSFIPGNLKTNLGLIALSKWLQLPLLSAKRKMFADLFHAADEDLHSLEHHFLSEARGYSTVESAVLKLQSSKPKMQSYSYLDANKDTSGQTDNFGSNISPSNSNPSEIPSSLERPSVFAEPIQRKRKPMPFYNNTGSSQAASNFNGDGADYEKMQDDGFWSDDDNADLNGRLDELPSPKKPLLKPNPMVQAAPPKKTMKQVIEESTIRNPVHQDGPDEEEVKNSEHKTKRKKRKITHGASQKVEQSSQMEGDVNDKFFSDDENELNTTENSQDLTQKEEPISISNSDSNKTAAVAVKPKTVFTTILVVEEEDEEDEIEGEIANQAENKIILNNHSNNAKSDTITANSNSQNPQKDDGDFWSENDEPDQVEPEQTKSDSDNEDSVVKPNPLVQKVKPRTNNYKNVIPQVTETVKQDSNASQTAPITQDSPNQQLQQRSNEDEQSHITSPVTSPSPQNQATHQQQQQKQQQPQPSVQSNADSDDDFWNFDSAANKQAAAVAIQLKRQQNQQQSKVVRQKKKGDTQPASRPLVIPKSQVHQRTITIASSVTSNEKQQTESLNIQNPLIPTTDLFSDLPESKNGDFFGQPAQQRQTTQQQPVQKVDDTTKPKTVRKRKRVVKSSTNKNEQQSVAGYDSV